MRLRALLLALLATVSSACWARSPRREPGAAPPRPAVVTQVPVPAPRDLELANLPSLPLLRLAGDAYARGRAYGAARAAEWRQATAELEDAAVREARERVPAFLARFAMERYASHVVQRFSDPTHLTPEEDDYLRGIADGAGMPASRVRRLVAFVMLSDASCSAFVALGPATEDGRLLQMRNLDWGGDDLPAERAANLLVHEPPDGQRWLSIGFVGLVGSVTGVNESGISLSEIGAKSEDRTFAGAPMPLLLDRVLSGARTLDQAVAILRDTPTTGGYNFLVGSARERRGAVVERTAHHAAVFEIAAGDGAREAYEGHEWFRGFAGFDCRGDTAADPAIRHLQRCSRGKDGTPAGTTAYETRYRAQLERFEASGRRLDLARAFQIAEHVAPDDNLQSVVYDVERNRVYVGNRAWFRDDRRPAGADRRRLRAAAQPPAVVDLALVFPPR